MQLFPSQRYSIAVGLKTVFIFVRFEVLIAASIKISVLKIDAVLFGI